MAANKLHVAAIDDEKDQQYMRQALELAGKAAAHGEVPVGAVLVLDDKVIGHAYNQPISLCDPSAHAELLALRNAAKTRANYRLPGATLYVTVEPCTMCWGTMMHARIARLVYGTVEPRAGVVKSALTLADADFYNHKIQVSGGVLKEDCAKIMKDFFSARRK